MGYIYKITNLVNNKCYIGQTRRKDLSNRVSKHLCDLRRNHSHNQHLQNSWNKYGEDNFKFELIEIVDDFLIDEKEQYWVDYFKAEYNKRLVVTSNFGRKMSEETKTKLSKLNIGKIGPNKGKKFSKVVREKMSLGKKGIKLSIEHINKIRLANTGKVFSKIQRKNISKGLKNSYNDKFERELNLLSYANLKEICIKLNIKLSIFNNKAKLISLIIKNKRYLNDAVSNLKVFTTILNEYNINLYRAKKL